MAKLYVCPTPIGNLEDMTLRTIRVLQEADVIAAEDTRHTLRLMNHLNIKKHLISLHEHNEQKKSDQIISLMKEGKRVALVSDAGMPGISDPGEILIGKTISEGIPLEVLPGPVAFATALVGSGLPTGKFLFYGFLDRASKKRKKELRDLQYYPYTLIFYESPHRIKDTVEDLYQVLGDRGIVIARELTKKYEEYIRTSLSALLEGDRLSSLQGEMVIILEGSKEERPEEEVDSQDIREELTRRLEEGESLKDASKDISRRYGLKRNEVYEMGISIKEIKG